MVNVFGLESTKESCRIMKTLLSKEDLHDGVTRMADEICGLL